MLIPVSAQLHHGYVDFVYNIPHILSYSDVFSLFSLFKMEYFFTYRYIINMLEMNGILSELKISLYWYLFY